MSWHRILIIVIASVVTILLRFLPFIIFRGNRKTPDSILYLGRVLPYAVMGMLVVFALKDVSIISRPHAIPEVISVLIVIAFHLWKRNTLLSILSGTISYMLLVQFVFV